MTVYPELTVTIDNRPVQWEEIKHWKAKRALVVLQLFADYGQKVILKNHSFPVHSGYRGLSQRT